MKALILLLIIMLAGCASRMQAFQPDDIIYIKWALRDTVKFKVIKMLPDGRVAMWDLNTGKYVESRGSNLKLYQSATKNTN